MAGFVRRHLSTMLVAFITAAVTAAGPVVAATIADYARNADKVDGKHAVGAGASPASRAGKLVATASSGRLPNDIIAKAPDANLLDGKNSTAFSPSSHLHDGRYVKKSAHTTAAHNALNIDAQTLDGRSAEALSAAATHVQTNNFFPFITSSGVRLTRSVSAPSDGFVVLNAAATASGSGCTSMCNSILWLRNVTADQTSPRSIQSVTSDRLGSVSATWVVPVTAGTHDFELIGGYYNFGAGSVTFYNEVLTAVYVPSNAAPVAALSAPSLSTDSADLERTPSGRVRR